MVHMKAYEFDADGKAKEIDIPAEGRDVVDKTRERLVELVAESDDALMEKYFEQGTLEDADILPNINKAIAAQQALSGVRGFDDESGRTVDAARSHRRVRA